MNEIEREQVVKRVLLTIADSLYEDLMNEVKAEGWGRIQSLLTSIIVQYLKNEARMEAVYGPDKRPKPKKE